MDARHALSAKRGRAWRMHSGTPALHKAQRGASVTEDTTETIKPPGVNLRRFLLITHLTQFAGSCTASAAVQLRLERCECVR